MKTTKKYRMKFKSAWSAEAERRLRDIEKGYKEDKTEPEYKSKIKKKKAA